MKTSSLKYAVLAIFAVLILYSCKKKDDTAPVITIVGNNPMNVAIGSTTYSDPGATALDDTDGDLTASIVVRTNVHLDLKGNYNVTYSVSDAAGNEAEEVRNVYVINQSEFLVGDWTVTDNKVGSSGPPVQSTYADEISTDGSENNRFWVKMFGNNLNASVYLDRVSATQCQIPQQDMTCGEPPANHKFFGSATILDSSNLVLNYTEIVGSTTYSCSATYERR